MKPIIFKNQSIICLGDNTNSLYRLTSGKAEIVDNDHTIQELEAPCYLNLVENVFECDSLKTVKAVGRCQVVKMKLGDKHRNLIKHMKQSGLRKHIFPIFSDIPCPFFYQLTRYSDLLSVEKGRSIEAKKNHLYFCLEGKIIVEGGSLKILELGSGQLLSIYDQNTNIQAGCEAVRLAVVTTRLAEAILGMQYNKILAVCSKQKRIMETMYKRNQRLSQNLLKKYQEKDPPKNISPQLVNKIQIRALNFQKYCRAKSCFLQGNIANPKQIMAENQQKFRQLLELNRKKYGQEYIFKKRLEVSRKVHSLTHNTIQKAQTHPIDLSQSIYEVSSLKLHYGIMKPHPFVKKEKNKKGKESKLVRRSGLSKAFLTFKGGSSCQTPNIR